MPNAVITGASRGLGLALARSLAADGWRLTLGARGAAELERAARELGAVTEVVALAGDVTDPRHRRALVAADGDPVDLLVANASILGPSTQPPMGTYPLDVLERVLAVNTVAPLALIQLALPHLARRATIITITSDAALEAYPGWG